MDATGEPMAKLSLSFQRPLDTVAVGKCRRMPD
jgi:hypothetical protein